MNRTNIYFTDQQAERLRLLSKKSGLSVAELVRRAIDAYWDWEGLEKTVAKEKRRKKR